MQRAFSSPHSPGARSGAAPVDHGHALLSKDLLANLEVVEQKNKCLLGTKYHSIIAQKLTERAVVHFKCIILLSQVSSVSEELGKKVVIPVFHDS